FSRVCNVIECSRGKTTNSKALCVSCWHLLASGMLEATPALALYLHHPHRVSNLVDQSIVRSRAAWWIPIIFTIDHGSNITAVTESGANSVASTRKPSHEPSPNPPRSQNTDQPSRDPAELDIIHTLLANPALADPIRLFPSMQIHYWSNVLNILRRKVGAEVIVTAVPGTGSIESRAEALDQQLQRKARGRGVNFLAHSMGGLDCRHLISHIKPTEYIPLSLTSVSTPHRGSPSWIGARFPPLCLAFLNVVDSPAYANLTTSFLNDVFNPQTPDDTARQVLQLGNPWRARIRTECRDPCLRRARFIDWGRFASAWKKEEKAQAAAATPEEVKDRADNALIRKSTETLSSVVDWLVTKFLFRWRRRARPWTSLRTELLPTSQSCTEK
ncbi:unnamed protein product, partial [Mycena citricolor]